MTTRKNEDGSAIPRSRRKPDKPIPPGTCAGAFGRNGATTSAHQEPGVEMMNGRFGKKNAESINPASLARVRNPEWGVSFQTRIRRKGAITIAICFTAMERTSDTQLALG